MIMRLLITGVRSGCGFTSLPCPALTVAHRFFNRYLRSIVLDWCCSGDHAQTWCCVSARWATYATQKVPCLFSCSNQLMSITQSHSLKQAAHVSGANTGAGVAFGFVGGMSGPFGDASGTSGGISCPPGDSGGASMGGGGGGDGGGGC